ncbi:hypothetical protein ACN2C3_10495 [Aliarcobacter butzleri]
MGWCGGISVGVSVLNEMIGNVVVKNSKICGNSGGVGCGVNFMRVIGVLELEVFGGNVEFVEWSV